MRRTSNSILRFARLAAMPLLLWSALACASPPATDFAELEKAGAVIGKVRVQVLNIFDEDDPSENSAPYRLVNRLHIVTRKEVIERMLLFRSGEKVSAQKIRETDRLLQNLRIINDADIRAVAQEGNTVDIDVIVRDTWSLDLTGNFSRSGGNDKSKFGVRERNLLGTGISLGYARSSDADRSGNELDLGYSQAFDGWTQLSFSSGRFDDGRRTSVVVDRPFYSLDTRYAGRAAWNEDNRIDPIYNAGVLSSEYRHKLESSDLSAGWSPGLVNGWTQRFSAGVYQRDDHYLVEPGRTLAVALPIDHDVRAPFLRYDVLEDEYVKVRNFNRIQRAEFLKLGLTAYVQLGRSLAGLGSSRADWLYAAGVSDGTSLSGGQKLLARAAVERRIGSTATPLTQAGVALQFYAPQGAASLFYAAFSADRVTGGGVADQFLLGGNEGLRGYPARYQSGINRALLTVEKRVYTDWYPLRLVRVGGAAFLDSGRAWGGLNQNLINGGWLTDVGVGLRIAVDRAAFDNVLHIDLAVPLNRDNGIKAVQYLVKTEFAF